MNGKKLMKGHEKLLAGVCSGIAEYFDIDVTLVRAIYAVASVFVAGFPGVILYIILAIVMPEPTDNF